jgi:hypothetical protein
MHRASWNCVRARIRQRTDNKQRPSKLVSLSTFVRLIYGIVCNTAVSCVACHRIVNCHIFAIWVLFRLIHKMLKYHGWLDHKSCNHVVFMDEKSSIRTQKQEIVRVLSIILSLFNHKSTRKSRWDVYNMTSSVISWGFLWMTFGGL